MGRLTLNMLMSFAEFEREMIAERTRDKIAAARRKGKWTGGPVPLGYEVEDKRLVVKRHRSTKRHRAAKRQPPRGSCVDEGRRPPGDQEPCPRRLHALRVELHEGEHEPLIERETFTRARALLEAATKTTAKDRGRNPEYILRSVLRCACCGSAFTPASTKKGRTTHRYYRCVKRDKEGKEACPSSPLPANAIEAYVVDRLREATLDGGLAADGAASVKQRVTALRGAIVTERQKFPAEIASLSAEARRLVDSMSGVTGTARRLVDERLQQVGDQLARCEAQLAAADRELANLDALEVEVGWVAGCLADFDAVWDVLTPENRGRLLRSIVQRVEVNEPSNQVAVVLADLGAEVPVAEPEPPPAQPEEVSP